MSKLSLITVISAILLLLAVWQGSTGTARADQLEDVIGTWAEEFGDELWRLGQSVTKLSEIKARYKSQNVKVKRRDGEEILDSIVGDLQTMVKRKVDSVKCIMHSAEEIAEEFDETDRVVNYTYFSSKYSPLDGEVIVKKQAGINYNLYRPIWLHPHRSFNNIPINTSHSSVHMPTNLRDEATRVLDAVQWSEALNDVFLQNYETDPALSWQYFGDSSGFTRNFPAMHWNQQVDQYDFRFSQSYIGSSTSPKDMVILMDTTGSMRGMRIKIARLSIQNILDTLSSNDYVNVFNFSDTIQEMIPCYKDTLVPATQENVNLFKEAVNTMTPEGHANFSTVFTQAFQLLQEYREIRGCNETGAQCNQVIMLVSDGVPYNITEVFEEYNWFDNGTTIPVRVFTYLVGIEVAYVREIQLMACLNKGYYVHIHSLNEVRERVFKYIPVLARPLVLQGEAHPITWTSVYADITDPQVDEWLWDVMENSEQKDRLYKYERNKKLFFSQRDSDRKYVQQMKKEVDEIEGHIRPREYHLIISVSMPAFHKKINENDTRPTNILGVAGTDIYLDHIQSLTNPYKIGVNGYAFIIDNNGHLVLHPELRAVSGGVLKENFNSIDLIEVEMIDDDQEPRHMPPEIMQLREAMINQSRGKMENVKVKYHYDDMHRVAVERRNYFYAPLEGTPFTVGLALPSKYGFYNISVRDEVKTAQFLRTSLSDYFHLYNWKLRPDWVYCKYHHEHMFNSSEQELRHFLDKMSSSDWQWKKQYEDIDMDSFKYSFAHDEEEETEFAHCGAANRPSIDTEDYYCNKDLVLLLISDAKVTSSTFENPRWEFKNREEEDLLMSYNTTLRFISTQSGLTRWQYMLESDEKEYHRREFGNLHKRAIEESWYRSAILQHQIDPESFVYSLAFDKIGLIEGDAMVTASYAMFHRDGGKEAPAAVIGMQFRQTALFDRFMKFSTNTKDPGSREQCVSDEIDCFVLDSGGYIIITENVNDTGRFFGEIDGAVMEAMVHENIYRKITVFDYEALCFEVIPKRSSDGNILLTPLKYMQGFVQWIFGAALWAVAQTNLYQLWSPVDSVPMKGFPFDLEEEYYDSVEIEDIEKEIEDANQTTTDTEKEEFETISHPCDQKADLYLLQQDHLKRLHKEGYTTAMKNCSRPFYVRHIPHSNLLLVVVDAMYPSCYRVLSADLTELNENVTHYECQKADLNDLPRRKLSEGFAQHPGEEEMTECGDRGSQVYLNVMILLFCFVILLLTDVGYSFTDFVLLFTPQNI